MLALQTASVDESLSKLFLNANAHACIFHRATLLDGYTDVHPFSGSSADEPCVLRHLA